MNVANNKLSASLKGMKMAFPVVLGYLPLGFAFGVLAVKSGIPFMYTVLMSIMVYAGSGQFIAASMVGMGAPIISIVVANLLVNLRYFLMVSTLLEYIRPFSFFKKIFFAAHITDEVFAVHHVYSKEKHGSLNGNDTFTVFSVNITSHLGWIIGTILGAFSGELMTDIKPFGLDYALPAMFIALLVPLCFDRLQCIVALLGAGLYILCVSVGLGKYGLVISAIIAACVGAYFEIKKEKENKQVEEN